MAKPFIGTGDHVTDDYFLTTQRLGFREWTMQDIPLAISLWGDVMVTNLIDARGQLTHDQVTERLTKEIASMKQYGVQYWPIFELATGEFLGCCGLRPYRLDDGTYELGVHLCADRWGRGYATEAGAAVINYAFEKLGAKGLFAGHHPRNAASSNFLQKLGFRHTHDEYYPPTGLQHPSYLLSLEEFNSGKKD